MTPAAKGGGQLSNADVALLGTLRFQKMLDSGGPFMARESLNFPGHMLAPVRPKLDPQEEEMLVSGPIRMQIWDAPGDGSYNSASVPIVATGLANRDGMNFAVGAALGSAAVNMFSRRKARKDMQARWMDFVPQGVVTVSTHGIYTQDPERGVLHWGWGAFDAMQVVAPSTVEAVLPADDWSGRMVIHSDWAELMFVSWIAVCFPKHPGKYAWVPDGWGDRLNAALGFNPLQERAINAPTGG